MPLVIRTDDPTGLLDAIKEEIDNGEIITWAYDEADDFTHTARQWKYAAWLRPTVRVGSLMFRIVESEHYPLTPVVNGIYLGRFTEMLVTHFADRLLSIRVTP